MVKLSWWLPELRDSTGYLTSLSNASGMGKVRMFIEMQNCFGGGSSHTGPGKDYNVVDSGPEDRSRQGYWHEEFRVLGWKWLMLLAEKLMGLSRSS